MALTQTLSIGYTPVGASAVVNKLKSFCEQHHVPHELSFQTCVVAAEALNNIIKHSPRAAHDGFIKVSFNFLDDHITISLVYWCPEFSPPEDPTCPETEALSGRGWHIIHSYMDQVRYQHNMGMNTLVLIKNLPVHHAA